MSLLCQSEGCNSSLPFESAAAYCEKHACLYPFCREKRDSGADMHTCQYHAPIVRKACSEIEQKRAAAVREEAGEEVCALL